jgi:hypothetical protein
MEGAIPPIGEPPLAAAAPPVPLPPPPLAEMFSSMKDLLSKYPSILKSASESNPATNPALLTILGEAKLFSAASLDSKNKMSNKKI